MSRADELSFQALEAGLSAAEEAELEGLLRGGTPTALLDTVRALRAAAVPEDLGERVMARVQEAVDGRVRRGVLERIGRRRSFRWIGAAAAALLIAAGAALYMTSGPAVVARLDGVALRDGASVRTEAPALLVFPDGSELRLSKGVSIDAVHARELVLAAGRLEAEIRPQAETFGISTPQGRAEVIGTRFVLEAGRTTRLEVAEGKVRLSRRSDGTSALVAAGEEAEADPAGPVPTARRTEAPVARWAFDGDGKDAALTLEGAEAVAGRRGGGLRCGTGGFTAPAVYGEQWTLALWLRQGSLDREATAYLATGPRPGDLILERVGTVGPTRVRVKSGGRSLDVTLALRAGEWFELALSWDGRELRLNHDGVEAGRLALDANPASRPGLRIGASAVPGAFEVDDVRLYDRLRR